MVFLPLFVCMVPVNVLSLNNLVMSIFSKVPVKRHKVTEHNLSHPNRMTANFGFLYPMLCRKGIPGDTWRGNHEIFAQMATMQSKVYQQFNIRTEYFFVPSRLLWEDFEDFMVGGYDGQQVFVHPYFNYRAVITQYYQYSEDSITKEPYFIYTGRVGSELGGYHYLGPVHGSLFDYFNFPTFPARDVLSWDNNDYDDFERLKNIFDNTDYDGQYNYDALPFLAYFKIFVDHYADENLNRYIIDEFEVQYQIYQAGGNVTDSVLDITGYFANKRFLRNYPKDYFTGALPFLQKGAQVNLPFTGTGLVRSWLDVDFNDGVYNSVGAHFTNPEVLSPSGTQRLSALLAAGGTSAGTAESSVDATANQVHPVNQDVIFQNGLTSINDLRTALQVQNWLEINARGGTRYNEQILSHFGVRTRDYRLDRSEFIMATSQKVQLGNVYSTTMYNDSRDGVTGEPVTVGKSAGVSRKLRYFVHEHGYLIAFVSAYPKSLYSLGVPREYMELDKFDYYWPEFQHLSEQEVFNSEVELGSSYEPKKPFGYQYRYSHYKVALGEIHGDFRDSLRFMVDSRRFHDLPLSSDFISIDDNKNELNRIFNYTKGDYKYGCIQLDIFLNLRPYRPMSYFGLPRLIG